VLCQQTQARLATVLRGFASFGNPVDVTGQVVEDVSILRRSLDILVEDAQIAVCVMWVQLLHPRAEELADLLIEARQRHSKPFVLCWLNAHPAAMQRLRAAEVCVTESTRGAIQAAVGLVQYGRALRGASSGPPLERDRPREESEGRTQTVSSLEAALILQRHGLKLVPTRLAHTAAEAAECADELGYPVAVKIESADLPHKTEAGGVRLGLRDAAAVCAAFDGVVAAAQTYDPGAVIEGALVQRMAEPQTELVLGLRRDPVFGPIVMVGLGGIFIEVLKDVVFSLPPLNRNDAFDMIGRLRSGKVLRGVRGKPPVDLDALADAICCLSELAQQHPEIVELDLNPVFAGHRSVVAVDWLMVREKNA